MSEKRRRSYRERVLCSLCKKKINSDYKNDHATTQHPGECPSFSVVLVEGQSTLSFSKRARIEDPPATSVLTAPSISSPELHDNDSAKDAIDFHMNSKNMNAGDKTSFDHIDSSNEKIFTDPLYPSSPSVPSTSRSGDHDQGKKLMLNFDLDSSRDDDEIENIRTVKSDRIDTTNIEFPHLSSSIVSSPSTPKSVHDYDEVENSRTVQSEENATTIDELLSPNLSPSIVSSSSTPRSVHSEGEENVTMNSDLDTSLDDDTRNIESAQSNQNDINDVPCQPILDVYHRKFCGNERYERDFSSDWFKQYPWLEFSVETKTASCFACKRFLGDHKFEFTNWRKPERLLKHHDSEAHDVAMQKWISFRDSQRKKTSIAAQLDTEHQKEVRENREYLRVIIQCLAFTAQQNIGQRGHREDRENIEMVSDVNRGNFLELLHLRCQDIPWLAAKLKSQLEHHKQWTSWDIQNELLDIMSDLVRQRIVSEVGKSKFSVIMDETADITKTEQVSICLSFVYKGVKKESFIGFFDTKKTDAQTLLDLLKNAIESLNLDMASIVGECFDGASNMSGCEAGLQTLMKEFSPFSLYVHCYAHRLNLALNDSLSSVKCLRDGLGTVEKLYVFIGGSAKRIATFKDIKVDEDLLNLSLKALSETRWACRHESVRAVDDQLERIVKLLIFMKNDPDCKSAAVCSDARNLLISICSFEFLFSLAVLKFILLNTNGLSKYLQGKNVDVFNARKFADMTISTLSSCREESHFDLIWEKVKIISEKVKRWIDEEPDIDFQDPILPRARKPSTRQQALVGEDSTDHYQPPDASSKYRIEFYSGMDAVLGELRYRFQGRDNDMLCALGHVCLSEEVTENHFSTVAEFYKVNLELLKCEHRLFRKFVESHPEYSVKTATDLVEILFQHELSEIIPLFSSMATIFACIPASSCSAERSFSTLRRLKTYIRSTMGQKRVSNLAILNIERCFTNRVLAESMDSIIDIFGRRKNRNTYFF